MADAVKIGIGQRVFEYAKEECGGDIARLLATTVDSLPDSGVQMLVWLTTEPHDTNEDAWRGADRGQLLYDIYTNGINTTRGRATHAMAKLIANDATYIQRFDAALERLASEPQPSVASCMALALRTLAYHDAGRALSLFQRMDFSEERLLATRHVYGFIRENMEHRFVELRDVILRALRSAHPDVRQTGARLTCLAALHHAEARDLATEARRGDVHQRRGVAEVASANIGDATHRRWCEGALRCLFSDNDAEVRKIAASCFRYVPEDGLDAYGDLIEAFCASQAHEENPFPLIRALKNARSQLPGTVFLACESFLDRLAAGDTRSHIVGRSEVVELAFRIYQHHQNDEWASAALDLIDRVCLELDESEGFEDFDR